MNLDHMDLEKMSALAEDELVLSLDALVHEYGEACLRRDIKEIAVARELLRNAFRKVAATLMRMAKS